MNVVSAARGMDALIGLVSLVLAVYFFSTGSLLWAGAALLSAAVSFLSVKFVPARWLARKIMLARLK